jgi:hypothetical protein
MMRDAIEAALSPLVGLKLSVLHYAGNMRIFHFGKITTTHEGIGGQYAMHVQCPWRIRQHDEIITGLGDWYQPKNEDEDLDSWDPCLGGSVQELQLRTLLACSKEESRSVVNKTNRYVVTSVKGDDVGGCQIAFSEDLLLEVFPNASVGEAWRLLRPDSDDPHFVVGA